MGKFVNSSSNNAYGGGKEGIYISDSGKSYTVSNSSADNVYGDGKEIIITENGSNQNDGNGLLMLLIGLIDEFLADHLPAPLYYFIHYTFELAVFGTFAVPFGYFIYKVVSGIIHAIIRWH